MDEMNLADLVREISRSVQQTVSNNSKTFVEIRRTVDSTVKEIKDTVLETVDTVKNTAARPKTPPKPAPYQPQWVDGKLMKRSAPGKITGLLLALLGAVPGVPIVAALVVSAILLAVKGLNLSAAVAGSVLLVVLLIVGGFSWDRWLRYDDAAEFQGEWQTHGTTAVVVIDGETIKLTEDVSWSYTLDTDAKTISYTFGNMEGSGRYRFSLDRSQLVISDGDGYSWLSTLTDDIAWQFDQLVRAIQGQPQEEPQSGAGCTVLDRLSHDAEATPQRGEPVAPEPEPEPAAEPEPEAAPEPDPVDRQKPESDSASGPEDASASEAADEGGSASDAVDKNDDAAASGTRGVFDVSDLPA